MATNRKAPRPHRFLRIARNALNRVEARDRIREVLRSYGVDLDSALRENPNPALIFTDSNKQESRFRYLTVLEATARTGTIPEADRIRWRDTHPEGTISAGTDATDFPEMVLATASGIHVTSPLEAPGYLTNDVLSSLLADVLSSRREAVRASWYDNTLFERCFRAYRFYLVASISAVDAYLNSTSWFALKDPTRTDLSKEGRASLEKRRVSIVVKLKDWPQIMFGCAPLEATSPERAAFEEMRQARNAFVHVNSPEFNFSLRRAATVLNLCREGVGGLLMQLDRAASRNSAPPVLAVRFAPLVSFSPRHDGAHP